MKKLLLTIEKQNLRTIGRMIIILLMFGTFETTAYSQISTTSPASRCGAGSLVLHATTSSGTIKWYTVPFYGTAISTGSSEGTVSSDGTSFTTKSLSVTKTYYVDAVDANGCSVNVENKRVPVIATISANSIQASIFYASNTFCKSLTGKQQVTRTGTIGGTFTANPAGLKLDAITGEITPSASTNGQYTVTYTVVAAEGCVENPASTQITITNEPEEAFISYVGSPYCTSHAPVAVTQTGATGGTYSATPSGLTLNTNDGTITPATSLGGTYTVTYYVRGSGGCSPQTKMATITITTLPTAVISYTGAPFCGNNAIAQTPTLTGTGAYTGGTFSASGLTINPSTGAITPADNAAGNYTVNYTAPASSSCSSVTVGIPVTIKPLPTATITGSNTVCQNGFSPKITFTGSNGTAPYTFTYKVNNGGDKFVTTSSGNSVDVTQSTVSAGIYEYKLVGVSDANGCLETATGDATITVTGTPIADFSYTGSPFCKAGTASPVFVPGGSAGTFTSTPSGVVFNTGGVIDLVATPTGNYTITNTITSCGSPVSYTSESLTINELPTAIISGNLTACGTTILSATTDASSPTFTWYKDGVVIADQTASTLNVTTDGNYTVKVTNGDTYCENTSSASTVTIAPLPTASISAGTTESCATPIILTAQTNATSPTYTWYMLNMATDTYVATGATGSQFSATLSGYYKVKINNGTCENMSEAFFVTISQVIDPGYLDGGQTVCIGANSTSLTLNDTKCSVVRWESSVSPFSSWNPITNTTTAYTVTDLTETTKYRAVVRNGSCPIDYSAEATVTVAADPTISAQPTASTNECIGGNSVLSVIAANGSGAYTYQWYSNTTSNNSGGVSIEGETASTYTPETTDAGTTYYYVIVGDNGSGCGTVTSNVAAVTTVADQPSWTNYSLPAPTTLCVGETVAFSVDVTGGSGGTISWIRSDNPTPGTGTEITVTTGNAPQAGTWYYRPHYTPTCSGCTLADGTQTTVTVKSITTAPAITAITSSTSTSVSGTSEANAAITVYKSGTTSIGTTTADGSGNWSVTVTGLTAGDVITAQATATGKCVSAASTGKTVPAVPTGSATQPNCTGNTVANLAATGTGIKWYSAATSGTLYASTDVLSTGHYYASQTVNGVESTSRFDVTVTVTTLASPTAGTHTASATQIVWRWNTVTGAAGYKWNTTNNYASASQMNSATSTTETGLVNNTTYTRYVWAYNASGCVSNALMLTQTTNEPAVPVTFTTVNVGGSNGPTQADINIGYASTSLAGKVTITTQGVQEWIVPETRGYFIEAYGAAGGGTYGSGWGARINGYFNLTAGHKLTIVVGQQGFNGDNGSGGGGGGTFVYNATTSTLLMVAGGGGGAGLSSGFGGVIENAGANTGSAGYGGSSLLGNGGAGFTGNGTTGGSGGTAAYSFRNGAVGGVGNGQGGFGGGGGSYPGGGGGGGGYSGGNAYSNSGGYGGGYGGGSYNIGGGSQNWASWNNGRGWVNITPQ